VSEESNGNQSIGLSAREFLALVIVVLEGGAFLAVCLGVEWVLVELAKRTIAPETKVLKYIFDGIQIGSGLAVLLLFIVHSVMLIRVYLRWERRGHR
jgi:hypothetical protein